MYPQLIDSGFVQDARMHHGRGEWRRPPPRCYSRPTTTFMPRKQVPTHTDPIIYIIRPTTTLTTAAKLRAPAALTPAAPLSIPFWLLLDPPLLLPLPALSCWQTPMSVELFIMALSLASCLAALALNFSILVVLPLNLSFRAVSFLERATSLL